MIDSLEDFFEMIDLKARGMAELVVLNELTEPKSAYETYSALSEKGIPIGISTLYTSLKELENKGFIKPLGEGRGRKYVITEKGKQYLKEREKELEKINRGIRRLKIVKSMGALQLIDLVRDLFKVADELTPEERAEISKALTEAISKVRPIIAAKGEP